MVRIGELNTKDLGEAVLLFLLTQNLPLPWWKWVIYLLSIIGITIKRKG